MSQMMSTMVGVVVLFWALLSCAQWVPVTGKVKQTKEVFGANGVLLERQNLKAGNYFRAANGSTLRQWTEVNGTPTKNVIGEMLDNRSGTNYRVEYLEKRAIIQFTGQPLSSDMYAEQGRNATGQDIVAGVNCSVVPAKDEQSGREVGSFCIALDYGLALRVEAKGQSPDGTKTRFLTELYDLQIGATPDPKLFDLTQFATMKMAPAKPR